MIKITEFVTAYVIAYGLCNNYNEVWKSVTSFNVIISAFHFNISFSAI